MIFLNMIFKSFVIFLFIDKKTYREVFEEFHPVRWSLQNACSGFIDNQLFLYFVELFLWHLKFMLIS